eukprot:2480442-Prymnesium_polylepis.1
MSELLTTSRGERRERQERASDPTVPYMRPKVGSGTARGNKGEPKVVAEVAIDRVVLALSGLSSVKLARKMSDALVDNSLSGSAITWATHSSMSLDADARSRGWSRRHISIKMLSRSE